MPTYKFLINHEPLETRVITARSITEAFNHLSPGARAAAVRAASRAYQDPVWQSCSYGVAYQLIETPTQGDLIRAIANGNAACELSRKLFRDMINHVMHHGTSSEAFQSIAIFTATLYPEYLPDYNELSDTIDGKHYHFAPERYL